MSESKKEYRSIVKGTAIFGGVQVFNILIVIIRTKIIAVFLGPQGSGIISLFLSAINPIVLSSGLGLNYSSVRTLSQATEQGDVGKLTHTVRLIRRWFWLTAGLGGVVTVIASSWLSRVTFGSDSYRWPFIWLGLCVMVTILGSGEIAVLQGTRRLKLLARASIVGAVGGLVLTVPLVWIWRIEAVVPILVGTALIGWLVNRGFARRAVVSQPNRKHLPWRQIWDEGKDMVGLGVVFMFTNLMLAVCTYLTNLFVAHVGSVQQVGLYQSASSMTNQYLGLIFSAMAVDYFPRLAGMAHDRMRFNQTVNQQAEITLLIALPLLVGMIVFTPLVVHILFSKQYFEAVPLIRYICLGMILKASAFAIGYMAGGLNDKKFIWWFEGIVAIAQLLLCNIAGYWFGGLEGLGISFVLAYAIYFIEMIWIVRRRYGFSFSKQFYRLFAIAFGITVVTFALTVVPMPVWMLYCVGGVSLIGVIRFSYKELNDRIAIKEMIRSKFSKKADNEIQG